MELEKESEYEVQLFDFSLTLLKLEHRLMVDCELKNVIQTITNKMVTQLENEGETEETLNEIKKKSGNCISEIYALLEPYFVELDDIVDKHFKIPSTVALPENNLHNQYTNKIEESLIADVEDMEKTFQQNQLMIVAMEAEIKRFESIKYIIEKEDKIAEFVKKKSQEIQLTLQNLEF